MINNNYYLKFVLTLKLNRAIFLTGLYFWHFRDPHGIATKKDKILSIVMIFLAVFSNVVAIYSNADAMFRKHVDPHQ